MQNASGSRCNVKTCSYQTMNLIFFLTCFVSSASQFFPKFTHLSSGMLPFSFGSFGPCCHCRCFFFQECAHLSSVMPAFALARSVAACIADDFLQWGTDLSSGLLPSALAPMFSFKHAYASPSESSFRFWLVRSPLGNLRPCNFPRLSELRLCSVLMTLGGIAGYGESRRLFES